jgi:peptide-methionine (S)-S-oxide reductase
MPGVPLNAGEGTLMKEQTEKVRAACCVLLLILLFAAPAPPVCAADQSAGRKLETATFAGGCFWCMQPPFDKMDGVVSTTVGYMGGRTKNPTYAEVSAGGTGHAESIRIVYDPARVSYSRLLEVFWHNIDPTTPHRQFCDVGDQYRAAIFYASEAERILAEKSKQAVEKAGRIREPIVTGIEPAGPFYPAEEYHQNYYRKNPVRYKFYRLNCGRDRRLRDLWGDSAGR